MADVRTDPIAHVSLETVSTVEAIRRAIEQLAFSGQLVGGMPLREHELADRFSVGRHSVRAALQQLVRDGIAVHEPNRGVVVRHFTLDEITDMYHLRGAVETEAVWMIKEGRIPRRHVDEALAQLRALGASADIRDLVSAGAGVHGAIVAEAGSPRLLAAFEGMLRELRVALAQAQVAMDTETPAQVLAEHEALVDDIWRLSTNKAVARIREHTAYSMRGVIAAIGDR